MKVGIAILSTDRKEYLSKLIASIEENTSKEELKHHSFFVFDDSEKEKKDIERICKHRDWLNFVDTGVRIGVANNTNNALEELSCFEYMLIMNNDVQVLNKDWILHYPKAMEKSGLHHFCFRQLGLWGACRTVENKRVDKRPDVISHINLQGIATIHDKPQGALLALTKKAFETVGYFNTDFPKFGGSHHLYSYRIAYSGIQPEGIHDTDNSNDFFMVHNIPSVTPMKQKLKDYREAMKLLDLKLKEVKQGESIYYEPESI